MQRSTSGLALLGRRWAPEIMLALDGEPKRFNWLLSTITGISDRVLTERLRDLVDAGLVRRDVEAGPPVRVSYSLVGSATQYLDPLRELAAL